MVFDAVETVENGTKFNGSSWFRMVSVITGQHSTTAAERIWGNALHRTIVQIWNLSWNTLNILYIYLCESVRHLSMYVGIQVPCACYETNRKLWNIRFIETTEDKVEIALVVETFTSDSVFRLIPFGFVLVFGTWSHSSSFCQMLDVAYTPMIRFSRSTGMHLCAFVRQIEKIVQEKESESEYTGWIIWIHILI